MKYSENMPTLNAVTPLVSDNYDQVFDLYCTKSKSWQYEREWRVFHQVAGTLYTYEPSVLKSVYFGPDIDNESLEIICLGS